MKHLLWILLIMPRLAAADVVVPGASVENFVNIRLSPDPGAEVVDRLRQGEWRKLVRSESGWHEVEIAGGATGYISADWTEVLAEPPPEEPPVPSVTEPGPVADAAPNGSQQTTTAAASGQAPAEPGTSGEESPPDSTAATMQVPADADASATEAAKGAAETDLAASGEARPEQEAANAVAAGRDDAVAGDETHGVAGDSTDVEASPRDVAEAAPAEAEDRDDEALADTDTAAVALLATPTAGPPGPPGPAGAANVKGTPGYLVRFTAPTTGANSLIYDDGNNIGIGTTEPRQRLEVNGNIEIHEQNSSVAGLMITQSDGETGYIMHNRASTLTIGAGSVDRITIDRDGNVGLGVTRPAHPLELANGAHVTAGGVWTNSSSRSRKENITELSAAAATAALEGLEPVQFNYRNDQTEQYVGFIAEDVPELVATRDRDGLSAMDIVAVLTRVVQEQQRRIEALEARLEQR